MSKQFFYSGWWKLFLAFAGVLGVNGCAAEKPIPPVFNLYGYQRIAVIPFDNKTPDPALAQDAEDEVTGQIVNLGAVPVIQAVQVEAFLQNLNASSSSVLTDEKLREQLAQKFQCDLFLMGSADGYSEFLTDTAPEQDGSQYGFHTNRKVVVNLSAKLVDPATGSLLWSGKNKGWSYYNTWNPLAVPIDEQIMAHLGIVGVIANLVKSRILSEGDVEPPSCGKNPSTTLIYPKSHYFNELRGKALIATVQGIVCDFQGRCGWVPPSK